MSVRKRELISVPLAIMVGKRGVEAFEPFGSAPGLGVVELEGSNRAELFKVDATRPRLVGIRIVTPLSNAKRKPS